MSEKRSPKGAGAENLRGQLGPAKETGDRATGPQVPYDLQERLDRIGRESRGVRAAGRPISVEEDEIMDQIAVGKIPRQIGKSNDLAENAGNSDKVGNA